MTEYTQHASGWHEETCVVSTMQLVFRPDSRRIDGPFPNKEL